MWKVWFMVFTPLSAIFQLMVAVSFIGGRNQSTWRKHPTCCKSLTFDHMILYWVHLIRNGVANTVMICTNWTCIYNANNNTFTTMTSPFWKQSEHTSMRVGNQVLFQVDLDFLYLFQIECLSSNFQLIRWPKSVLTQIDDCYNLVAGINRVAFW